MSVACLRRPSVCFLCARFQLAYYRANPNATIEAAVEDAMGAAERQAPSRLSGIPYPMEGQPPRSPRSVGQLLDRHDAAAAARAPSLSPFRGFRAGGGAENANSAFVPAASSGPR